MSTAAYAQDRSLVGSWKLVALEQQQEDGQWKARCAVPSGMITYTAQGYVSVGINCQEEGEQELSTDLKNMIFYTGTYTMKDHEVTHHVMNSNHVDYVGKDLVRTWALQPNRMLVLSGGGMANNTVRVIWQKL